MVGRLAILIALSLALAPGRARADALSDDALDKKIAVWRFDALGIDAEIVQRLETLFRLELARIDRVPLPSRHDIEAKLSAQDQACTGDDRCLTAIGRKLGVDYIVTGTVGSLGDNYVLNIKAVAIATGKSEHIQSPPLQGTPDELIEGVRVAAYSLLAPEQLHGALQIQSDLIGAAVTLDGKLLGRTPLPNQGVIGRLALGKHQLHVEANDYAPFDDAVEVHFQKVSPVVVRLLGSNEVTGTGRTIYREKRPVYTRTWFIVGTAVVAAAIGAVIGIAAKRYNCMPSADVMGESVCH